ncbi:hypothetical protein F4781DRAFT_297099 [Annulohypoxylon bovei var. microspora]|nr:hypothetical protein F4781DRAFT_297099 [Annulohypoxylon bovei var. microspora]
MDGKIPLEEPPPYTTFPTNHPVSDEFQLNSLTYHLQHHVTSLPDRIRATQQVRKAEQTLSDASLLDYIIPIVEEFLADLGARHSPVPLATLTLVPDTAVPKSATLSGLEDMKRRGEICRVSRISMESTSKDFKSSSGISKPQDVSDDQSWTSGQEFTGWGRFGGSDAPTDVAAEIIKMLWWRDEEMAHRLAAYLQPKKEEKPRAEQRSVVQVVVEQRIPQKKEKKSWLWGRRSSVQTSPESSPMPAETETVVERPQEERQRAEMTVTAQEVAFRQENELGIWESIRGWGIVLAVKVKT